MVSQLLLVLLVVGIFLAVFLKDLLYSALSLGIASIILAVIFFQMESPYAGVFELSVGAGMVTILFIAAISLINSREGQQDE
ncbi:MAG: hypothetical protein GX088_01880 [Clostridia bacterium]|nr:hypothetical protein [Clostridia bacterium]